MTYNQDFYNCITISDFILQLITLYMVSLDATNNELMEELQRQDKEYLDKIIENQNKILSILSEKDMSADKWQFYEPRADFKRGLPFLHLENRILIGNL